MIRRHTFEQHVELGQRLTQRVDPRFQSAVFDRHVRVFFTDALVVQQDHAAAQAIKAGSSVEEAMSAVQLDPTHLPTFEDGLRP